MKSKLLFSVFILLAVVLLSACSAPAAPQALPTVVLDGDGSSPAAPASANTPSANVASSASGSVAASGVIVPAQQVQLSAAQAGSVQTLHVALGQVVGAGESLISLAGSEKLAAAVSAAELELLAAQQNLDELNDNAALARAQAALRLAEAKDAFDKAERRRGSKEYRVGDDNQIELAQANLILAEEELRKVEEQYNSFLDSANEVNRAAAMSALSAARATRDKAQANLNYLLGLPDSIEVEKADAELQVAQAELDVAQTAFDQLANGPDPEALALAEARVQNATAQLDASRQALAELELKAPFPGVVSRLLVNAGEWVNPGQPLLILSTPDQMRVQTTDLSERDVPRISVGQSVTVSIKALGVKVPGTVAEISPLADTLGGDVVYQTVIDLQEIPEGLRAGMSCDVQFGR